MHKGPVSKFRVGPDTPSFKCSLNAQSDGMARTYYQRCKAFAIPLEIRRSNPCWGDLLMRPHRLKQLFKCEFVLACDPWNHSLV